MKYNYKNFYTKLLYGVFGGIFILLAIAMIVFVVVLPVFVGFEKPQYVYVYIATMLTLLMLQPLLLYIISIFKTEIQIDDHGISFSSLFKKMDIHWSEITSIRRRNIDLPDRLSLGIEIITRDKRKIKIYSYLSCENTKDGLSPEGVEYFETEIRKYVDPNLIAKDKISIW